MSPATPERHSRVLLRNTADINRLVLQMLAFRRVPSVAFRLDGLHVLYSQRAQDRFTRLADACNCLLGEVLAGVVALGGAYRVWVRSGDVLDLAAVALVAGAAWLVGKVVEVAWHRLQLLRTLFDLRHRLGTSEDSAERDYAIPPPAPLAAAPRNPATLRVRASGRLDSTLPQRERVTVRDAADVDRLLIHLATRLQAPRIDICIGARDSLDVQRAQAQVERHGRGCTYLPAAFLVAVTLLVGLLVIIWMPGQAWYRSDRADWWLQELDVADTVPVILAAAFAAMLGIAAEWIWNRAWLVRVLRGLRRQL